MIIDINTIKNKNQFKEKKIATDNEIKLIEDKLGLRFSKDYKEFLANVGACIYNNHNITGISSFSDMDVYDSTIEARILNPQVSNNLYVIEDLHFDGIYIWQDENGAIYQSSPKQQPKVIAESLAEYIYRNV